MIEIFIELIFDFLFDLILELIIWSIPTIMGIIASIYFSIPGIEANEKQITEDYNDYVRKKRDELAKNLISIFRNKKK